MKIIYLVTMLDGFGAALPIADVVKAMQDLGHIVEVVAVIGKGSAACNRLSEAGIRYRFIGDRLHQHAKPMRGLISLCRQEKPDVIWTSMIQATVYGQIAGVITGTPVVAWQHNAFLKPSNRRILRVTKRFTKRWVADSTAAADFAVSSLSLEPRDVDIWPLFYADPEQPRARMWDGNGIFRFGSLGRLHKNKRYDVLIEALAILSERYPEVASRVSFEIAGNGKQRASLEKLANDRGVANIKFLGYRSDPYEFLAQLHGYIQPSRNEGLCIAAHEAMHAGLPVLTTPVGELKNSVIPDKTGWIAEQNNPSSLAERIFEIFNNPEKAARIGSAAHHFVAEKFSYQNFLISGEQALANVRTSISLD